MKNCIIVYPVLDQLEYAVLPNKIEETKSLIQTLSPKVKIHDVIIMRIRKPNLELFFGTGQAQKIQKIISELGMDTVILDTVQINPQQQHNLAKLWKIKIMERTLLILEIFKQNATTHTGKLQVELAFLNYQCSRLVRSWEHLERQRGGTRYIAGPGEKQLELDRRILKQKIRVLKNKLNTIHRHNRLVRSKRSKNHLPVVSLAGYTCAGKSTLFNALTQGTEPTHSQPFTTLGTSARIWPLNCGVPCVLMDTIGFIGNLPHELIDAFRATLASLKETDFIIHVHDVNSQNLQDQHQTVVHTLQKIQVEDPVIINVFNKTDLAPSMPVNNCKNSIYLSALNKSGCAQLSDLMSDLITKKFYQLIKIKITNQSQCAERINWLYKHGYVISDQSSPRTLSFYVANHLVPEYKNMH